MKPGGCVIDTDDTGLTWDETWCMCTHYSVRDETDAGMNTNHALCVIDRDDTGLTWGETWRMCTHSSVRDDVRDSLLNEG
jgi:hypothetical protein